MRHGSLFSGIGGFDLAAEWMNWTNVFHCEWNKFGQQVLKHHFPKSISYDDITKTDFTLHRGDIDILTGGFPCQPYSSAGKRLGKEDERHLWPAMLRAIREIAPRYVVGENVRGLTNWNGGMVFDEVCTDLENLGYQVASYIIPAVAVNAPHKRERIWFVAYCKHNRLQCTIQERGAKNELHKEKASRREDGSTEFVQSVKTNGLRWNATDTDGNGLNECNGKYEIDTSQTRFDAFDDADTNDERGNASDTSIGGIQGHGRRRENRQFQTNEFNENNRKRKPRMDWQKFPTKSPICGGDDGLPSELDGITFSKWRNESIKAYGNAIVPQVAFEIFKAIQAIENLKHI